MSEKQEGKIRITFTAVEELLEQGFTRADIAKHFGISLLEVASIFKHPKLKNRKPKKAPSFEFIDDSEEEFVENNTPEVAETTEENTTFESPNNNEEAQTPTSPEETVEETVDTQEEVVDVQETSDQEANEDWDKI